MAFLCYPKKEKRNTMPNNLTPEYVIVTNEAVTAQIVAIGDSITMDEDGGFDDAIFDIYAAALSAAPKDHGFVIVNAQDWRRTCDKEAHLFKALYALEAVVQCMEWSNEAGERAYELAKSALEQKQ